MVDKKAAPQEAEAVTNSPMPAYDLPWSLEEVSRDGEIYGYIVSRYGTIVCEIAGVLDSCGNRQNAEFIVHAVNAVGDSLAPAIGDVGELATALRLQSTGDYPAPIRKLLSEAAAALASSSRRAVTEAQVEAACRWFDDNFNGMPDTQALVRGVLTAAQEAGR